MGPIDSRANVAARLNKPKGLDGKQPMGDGENKLVSSKAKVKERAKAQTLLNTRDGFDLICGAVYQWQSQLIIKVKQRMKWK